jgi:hypothetical protein
MQVLQQMRRSNLDSLILVLLVAVALTRGTLYAFVAPPFDSPDEQGHYDYVASLYQSGGTEVRGKERDQPPLYYWIVLPAHALFAQQTSDIEVHPLSTGQPSLLSLIAVRLISVLMTVATVPLAYLTAKTVCPKDRFVYLGTAAFVALEPAYGWLGAAVNNDNLARLLTAGMILMLLRVVARGFTMGRAAALVVLVSAGIAVKLITLPVAAVVVAASAMTAWSRLTSWRVRLGIPILLFTCAAAAVFLVAPVRSLLVALFKPWTTPGLVSTHRLSTFFANLDIWPFVYQFKTFWASFSTDSIQLPSPMYWLLAALAAASAAGLLVRLVRILTAPAEDSGAPAWRGRFAAQITILIGFVVVQWIVPFGRFYGNQPLRPDQRILGWEDNFALMQGRFLFPVMIPIGFLFVWGLGALLPSRWANHATWVLMSMLILVDWAALLVLAGGGHSWQVYTGQY